MRTFKTLLRYARDGLAMLWHGLAPWARPLYPIALLLIVLVAISAWLLLNLSSNEARREWLL